MNQQLNGDRKMDNIKRVPPLVIRKAKSPVAFFYGLMECGACAGARRKFDSIGAGEERWENGELNRR